MFWQCVVCLICFVFFICLFAKLWMGSDEISGNVDNATRKK